MKTTAVFAAILASTAMAQPHHGRHAHQKKGLDKRVYETEVVTETQWATLYIDEHGTSLQGPSPAQFYPSTTSEETTSTTSSSSSTSSSTSESTTTSEPTPSSTSTPPEPTTSTTEVAAKKDDPTTTSQAPVYTPTTAETAKPTSGSSSGSGSGSSSSGGGSSYSGDITLYDLVGYGACGNNLVGLTPSGASTSEPAVVALAFGKFTAANPNNDPLCGKLIEIIAGGVTGYGVIQDKCYACADDDIDINPEAFAHFMPTSVGRSAVSWRFIS